MIGDGLRSRTDDRRATEVGVAVHALNRMVELGRPTYVRTACPQTGLGLLRPLPGSVQHAAIAFLREASATFPFRLTHVLTDNGSCFTPAFQGLCRSGAEYRHTKPRTPQTSGMVERFNGRISSEVLGINIYSHRALEQLLRGFNAPYNARRQRVLNGKTPNQVVADRLQARPRRATTKATGQAGPCDITKARLIAEAAKEVSQPDN